MLKSLVGDPGGPNLGLMPASAILVSRDLCRLKRKPTIWLKALDINVGEVCLHCAVHFFVS